MKMFTETKKNCIAFAVLMAILLVVTNVLYTNNEGEMAVVFRFGKPVDKQESSGLYFKLPWPLNTSVVHVEKRLFNYDSDSTEITTKDKKTLVIDGFAPCRITDPILWLEKVGSLRKAQERIDDTVYSKIRRLMGTMTMQDIVVEKREAILDLATAESRTSLETLGMTVAAVRVNRVDLPVANQAAVFKRMSAERNSIAQSYRSEGDQEALMIKSLADSDREQILGEAENQALIIRGTADAEVAQVINQAMGANPEFYRLMKSLEVAGKVLSTEGKDRRYILKGKEVFLKDIFGN